MTQERDIPSADGELLDRRWLLRAFAGVGVAGVSSCCSLRPFATSHISEAVDFHAKLTRHFHLKLT
ncbi:hypothetical protein, partial [Comamonas testosteroni]|uniref:hypothetical protein n=1 Tax=Comamonas testosteroni TaxID=285 RepID=UPI0028E3254A